MTGFKPVIPTSEPPQTYALDRSATCNSNYCVQFKEQNTINNARTNTQLINLPKAATTSPCLATAGSMCEVDVVVQNWGTVRLSFPPPPTPSQ